MRTPSDKGRLEGDRRNRQREKRHNGQDLHDAESYAMCEFAKKGCVMVAIARDTDRQFDISKKVFIATSHTIGGKIPNTTSVVFLRRTGEGRTKGVRTAAGCTRGSLMGDQSKWSWISPRPFVPPTLKSGVDVRSVHIEKRKPTIKSNRNTEFTTRRSQDEIRKKNRVGLTGSAVYLR